MKSLRIALAAALLVSATASLTACSDVESNPTVSQQPAFPTSTDMEKIAAQTAVYARALVGLPEAKAIAQGTKDGYPVRVVHRDAELIVVTADYAPTRIDLSVDNGIVSAVSVG
jgi:hypothetical protein